MTLDEMEDSIVRLRIQNMVLRDYVIWLLAREIGSVRDPEATIRLADEFGNQRIASLASETQTDLLISELFQQEKDFLIAAASKVLRRD
jgi:hypothetical protein